MKLKIGKRTFGINFYYINNTPITVHGTTNRCVDGTYVMYLDYDKLNITDIVPEIEIIIEKFKLSSVYIFQSSHLSYHVICLDKITAREFSDILNQSSCDENFKRIPTNYCLRKWVLRFSVKGKKEAPKHIMTIISNYNIRQKSKPKNGLNKI